MKGLYHPEERLQREVLNLRNGGSGEWRQSASIHPPRPHTLCNVSAYLFFGRLVWFRLLGGLGIGERLQVRHDRSLVLGAKP